MIEDDATASNTTRLCKYQGIYIEYLQLSLLPFLPSSIFSIFSVNNPTMFDKKITHEHYALAYQYPPSPPWGYDDYDYERYQQVIVEHARLDERLHAELRDHHKDVARYERVLKKAKERARAEGKAEGIKEGKAEGRKEAYEEVAKEQEIYNRGFQAGQTQRAIEGPPQQLLLQAGHPSSSHASQVLPIAPTPAPARSRISQRPLPNGTGQPASVPADLQSRMSATTMSAHHSPWEFGSG